MDGREAQDIDCRRTQQVAQDVARPHRRQLVLVTHQYQTHKGRQRAKELGGQG